MTMDRGRDELDRAGSRLETIVPRPSLAFRRLSQPHRQPNGANMSPKKQHAPATKEPAVQETRRAAARMFQSTLATT